MFYKLKVSSLGETNYWATLIGSLVEKGDLIALSGSLGVGKTEFARFLIRSLIGSSEDVTSPTYNLVNTYHFDDLTIWHFDLYRLGSNDEVWALGLEEAISDGISIVEWPEKIEGIKFKSRLEITIVESDDGARIITFLADLSWQDRLSGII